MNSSQSSIQMRISNGDLQQSMFRFRIGQEPQYIPPKNRKKLVTQPDAMSETEFNSSRALPKFHSPTWAEEINMSQRAETNQKLELAQQLACLDAQYENKMPAKFIFLNVVIWLCYLIGSIQYNNKEMTVHHIVDCIGNGLALVIVVLNIYSKNSITSLSQVLHIWSILLTLAFLIYQVNNPFDQILQETIGILRCARLTFPLFLFGSAFELGKSFINLLSKSKKILPISITICFLIGIFGFQLYSSSLGNRCQPSQTVVNVQQWPPMDERLCGHRSCPNEAICRNPNQLGFQLSYQQSQLRILGKGLFVFDSSWQSALTIFQMFTLNSWGRVTQIYSDVFPSWLSIPFFILGILMFRKFFISLVVIFFDMKKLEREKINMLTGKIQCSKQDQKIAEKDAVINKIQSSKATAIGKSSSENITVEEVKNGKWKRVTLYCLAISFSVANMLLASQFGLHPQKADVINREVGIALATFFIIHFIVLWLVGYGLLDSEPQVSSGQIQSSVSSQQNTQSSCQKQIISTAYTLQSMIFFIHLSDYLLRIAQGKFILESVSGLTALSNFVLALRLYYVFLAVIDIFQIVSLKNHLMCMVHSLKSLMKYLAIFIIVASFIGVVSHNIVRPDGQNSIKRASVLLQINRFYMLLENNSWQVLFKFTVFGEQLQKQRLFVCIVGTICVIFGSIVCINYFVAHTVHESFWAYSKNKEQESLEDKSPQDEAVQKSKKSIKSGKQNGICSLKFYKQFSSSDNDDEQTKAMKKQKSLYIFAYENCLRQKALIIFKNLYYKDTIRFRFYVFYILVNIITCVYLSAQLYAVTSTVLEGIILLDVLLGSIALGFFGPFSYTQNGLLDVINVTLSFGIIILSLTSIQIQFVPLFQIIRLLVIFNSYESAKQTFDFIRECWRTILVHYLIFIPISCGCILLLLPVLSQQHKDFTYVQKLLVAAKLSFVIMCQKGMHVRDLSAEDEITTFYVQFTIFVVLVTSTLFSLSYYTSLSGIIMSKLVKKKKRQEQLIKMELCGSSSLLQDHKIKQKLLKIKPTFDYDVYGSGFLFKIYKTKLFKTLKVGSCLASVICFVILNTSLSKNQRIAFYTAHLFFFTVEILVFVCQSITLGQNQANFVRDLILTLLAFPGAYIGFVNPVQYSSQPEELKTVLVFFNALTVFRFIKILNYFVTVEKIDEFMGQKMAKAGNITAMGLSMTVALTLSLYLLLQKKQEIANCLLYVLIGMFGGDFMPTISRVINRNELEFTFENQVFFLILHLCSILFQTFGLAFTLFQLSDYVCQTMPMTNTQYSLFNLTQYFHENQFLDEWKKLDPQGKGFVNYSKILHKTHLFMRHFSVTRLPYKSYQNRVKTFKKLKIPIYECQTTIQGQQQSKPDVKKQYVITLYDFVYRLSRFAFKEMNSAQLIYRQKSFIRNIIYMDQPVSIINITNGEETKPISKFSKKVDQIAVKTEQVYEEWKKKSLLETRRKLKQKFNEHPDVPAFDCVLKNTKNTSDQLYSVHRLRQRLYKYLKKIQSKNELKIKQQVKELRVRQFL